MLQRLWREQIAPRLVERLRPHIAELLAERQANGVSPQALDELLTSRINQALAEKPWKNNIYTPLPLLHECAADAPFMPASSCSASDFFHPRFVEIARMLDLADPIYFQRKLWEWVFIIHAAISRNLTRPGMRALGFGVGCERIPAVFAKHGMQVVGTEAPPSIGLQEGWTGSQQYAETIDSLVFDNILERATFLDRVSLDICDMNHIEDKFAGFDFCWSASALEHLGGLQEGMDFIVASVEKTLKIGGTACHVTELNLSSNQDTVEKGGTVLYRKRDLDDLVRGLRDRGHSVDDIVIAADDHPLDHYVDTPPYHHSLHLKMRQSGYVITSVALVIQRGR